MKLIDVFDTPDDLVLITELMRGGDLYERMKATPKRRFEPPVASRLGAQLVAAVAYLHRNGIVHCDLKPSNILAVEPAAKCELEQLTVKLADFGLSQTVEKAKREGGDDGGGGDGGEGDGDGHGDGGGEGGDDGGGGGAAGVGEGDAAVGSGEVGGSGVAGNDAGPPSPEDFCGEMSFEDMLAEASSFSKRASVAQPESPDGGELDAVCGTPDYFAPELVALHHKALFAKKYDVGVDNWAIGCILWEFLCGETPFACDSEEVLFYNIEFEEPAPPKGGAELLPPEAAELIRGLLIKDAKMRTTSDQVLAHPWLAADVASLGLLGEVEAPLLNTPRVLRAHEQDTPRDVSTPRDSPR